MNRLFLYLVVTASVIVDAVFSNDSAETVPPASFDIIIDTDLGGDPDDIQSLFRAVHYSDVLKIKGIVSTPNSDKTDHPWDTIPNKELIKTWIQRIDVDHLRAKGFSNLMSEKELLASVKVGSQESGPNH